FFLVDAKNTTMPMDTGVVLLIDQSHNTHVAYNNMRDVPYQCGIGSLMYTATSTQSNIA
ncbi:hypothetical protein BDN67DRAFT_885268, partial [Paxillus ammoniavirescens]